MCLAESRQRKLEDNDVPKSNGGLTSALFSSGPLKPIKVYDTSVLKCLAAAMLGCILSFGTTIFSLHLPHVLTPSAAKDIYLPAFWSYDPSASHFDNSAWTYGTDYTLMIVMLIVSRLVIHNATNDGDSRRLRLRAACLLNCYAISVAAGGYAHHFFLTLESRNSLIFRLLWTICVGTVTAAGGFMGACASEIARKFNGPYVPEWFWIGFGGFTTAVCIWGFMSFQRPACDIFIAGITQFPPTAYLCYLSVMKLGERIPLNHRWMCVLGFLLNAPLLPLYSLLLKYTDWSLAQVNTLLHCWLCISWTIQGFALKHYANAIVESNSMEKRKQM
mmetsp:Transcript_10874/g.16721  ORF Transcript_10874/g.16721 Transcript_10874/m.16721 type:complete len:332 (-) Transcript_10874:843-1838(-)